MKLVEEVIKSLVEAESDKRLEIIQSVFSAIAKKIGVKPKGKAKKVGSLNFEIQTDDNGWIDLRPTAASSKKKTFTAIHHVYRKETGDKTTVYDVEWVEGAITVKLSSNQTRMF